MKGKEQECKQEGSNNAISVLEARVAGGGRNRHNGSMKKGSN